MEEKCKAERSRSDRGVLESEEADADSEVEGLRCSTDALLLPGACLRPDGGWTVLLGATGPSDAP